MKTVTHLKREIHCANYKAILIAILVNFVLGIFSALLGGSARIYRYLLLPHFAPSPWVFVLIWSLIYCLLGASIGIFLSPCGLRGSRSNTHAILWYLFLQFWLFLWYPVFFGARLFTLALILAAMILSTSLFLLRHLLKRSLLAVLLMIPCIAWFCFAFFLNFCVLLLN